MGPLTTFTVLCGGGASWQPSGVVTITSHTLPGTAPAPKAAPTCVPPAVPALLDAVMGAPVPQSMLTVAPCWKFFPLTVSWLPPSQTVDGTTASTLGGGLTTSSSAVLPSQSAGRGLMTVTLSLSGAVTGKSFL